MEIFITVFSLFAVPIMLIWALVSFLKDRNNKQRWLNILGAAFMFGWVLLISSNSNWMFYASLLSLAFSVFLFFVAKKYKDGVNVFNSNGASTDYSKIYKISTIAAPLLILVLISIHFISPQKQTTQNISASVASQDSETKRTPKVYKQPSSSVKTDNVESDNNMTAASSGENDLTVSSDQAILDTVINDKIAEFGDYINNIEQFDSGWDHVRVWVSDNVSSLSTTEKQGLADNLSSDVRGILGGYADQDMTKIFFTFSYADGSTFAESSMFDVYDLKLKD